MGWLALQVEPLGTAALRREVPYDVPHSKRLGDLSLSASTQEAVISLPSSENTTRVKNDLLDCAFLISH